MVERHAGQGERKKSRDLLKIQLERSSLIFPGVLCRARHSDVSGRTADISEEIRVVNVVFG